VHLRQLDRYEWPLYLVGEKDMRPDVDEYLQVLSSDFRTIDDGSPLGTEHGNNLGGSNIASSLALFDDQMLTSSAEHFYNASEGLLVHWDASSDALAFGFPSQDVRAYPYLHFRLSQRPMVPPNGLDTRKDFHVRVKDAAGHAASVALQAYLGGLQYPDESGSLPPGSPDQYKSIPRSYRVPLAHFEGVDLQTVGEVAFLFDRPDGGGFVNATGAIAVDDVEFTR